MTVTAAGPPVAEVALARVGLRGGVDRPRARRRRVRARPAPAQRDVARRLLAQRVLALRLDAVDHPVAAVVADRERLAVVVGARRRPGRRRSGTRRGRGRRGRGRRRRRCRATSCRPRCSAGRRSRGAPRSPACSSCSDVDERECIHTDVNAPQFLPMAPSTRSRSIATSPNCASGIVAPERPGSELAIAAGVHRALHVHVGGQALLVAQRAGPRAARRRVGRVRLPALQAQRHVVALGLERQQQVAVAPAGHARAPVVPQAVVAVELEGEVRRAVARGAREGEVEERAVGGRVDRRPGVEDVVLRGIHAARLVDEVPAARLVLLRAALERGVLRVRIGRVLDATGRLVGRPVDPRRGVELVAVRALGSRCRAAASPTAGAARRRRSARRGPCRRPRAPARRSA